MDDESGLIETSKSYMENGKHLRAFFCLALEAVVQIKRMADAQDYIADKLQGWDGDGYLNVSVISEKA